MLPFTLSSLLARTPRAARRRAQEPADMGTAFGMEQWLGERDHAAPPSPTTASPTARPVRWMPRWLQSARAPRG